MSGVNEYGLGFYRIWFHFNDGKLWKTNGNSMTSDYLKGNLDGGQITYFKEPQNIEGICLDGGTIPSK